VSAQINQHAVCLRTHLRACYQLQCCSVPAVLLHRYVISCHVADEVLIVDTHAVHTDCLYRQGELQHTFYSLNEFIVNRGLSGVLSTLEVYVDGQLVTTAQGDGTR
jgi:NAD kinase